MASTLFQDYNQNNPIVSSWLNDINNGVYSAQGLPRKAAASSAAWVRFDITAGVITVGQVSNIGSVVRTAVGVYVITYVTPLTNPGNCYEISMGAAGFAVPSAESVNGLTITCTTAAGAAVDPPFVGLTVHGAN